MKAITLLIVAGMIGNVMAQETVPVSVKATLTIHADQPGGTINRNIYGQFAEHLGRGIYEGDLGRARSRRSRTRAASAMTWWRH